jgi:hypothetical protein
MAQLFSALRSPPGGFLMNLLGGRYQRGLNEQARAQQEALFGQTLGMLGLGDLPGIPSVAPPPGMDISQYPGQALMLSRRLTGQSQANQASALDALEPLGPMGPLAQELAGLPGQFGPENQAILEQFGRQTGDITGQFQRGAEALRRRFARRGAGITGGYESRLGTAMGMLEGRGRQAEEDISTRFRESLGGQLSGLRARGFGGTMAANIAQGSVRDESAEQRRLQEQLRGERLGLFGQMSGEGLAAQERLLGAGTTLGQGLLGAGTGLQAGFAGEQLGAGLAGQQFLGGLNLGALGQRGQLGQFYQQQLGQIGQQNLANQFLFGQYPIGVGQQVAGTALSMLGPLDIRSPQQLQFPQIYPPVR